MTTSAPRPAPTGTPPPPSQTHDDNNHNADPFDSLLTLEDQFYREGYDQGAADGLAAGRAEGRQLGLERGFQKFVESGRLEGRAIVWANRLRLGGGRERGEQQQQQEAAGSGGDGGADGEGEVDGQRDRGGTATAVGDRGSGVDGCKGVAQFHLPPLPDNPRLAKHIATLYALVETESLSTENTDEAVSDFDDRLRRAQGRAKIIERMVGEGGGERQKAGDGHGHGHDPESSKGEGAKDV